MRNMSFNSMVACSLSLLGLLMFVYVVYGLGGLYFQHDAYYYLGIAESLIDSGEMLDVTNTPSLPVVSPQNGIVFIIALLKNSGISSNVTILYIVSAVNYCFFVWFCYLVYKIYRIFNIDRQVSFVVVISIILSLFYARIYIQVINDPIFITLTTFVFYLVLQKKEDWKTLCLLLFCALFLSEFRVSGVLVFLSAALTYFYLKKIKMGLLFMGLSLLTYITQAVLTEVFIINQEGINALKKLTIDQYSLNYFLKNIGHTFRTNIPESLFSYAKVYNDFEIRVVPLYIFISGSVLVGYFYIVKKALTLKEFNYIYMMLYITAYICFLQLFFVLNTRYILPIAPLFTLLLFLSFIKTKKTQLYFSYILLTVSLIFLVLIPPNDLRSKEGLSKSVYYEKMREALRGQEYEVLSPEKYSARVNYLLLNKASFTNIKNIKANKVVIAGSSLFCSESIGQLIALRKSRRHHTLQLEPYIAYNGAVIHSYLIEFQ